MGATGPVDVPTLRHGSLSRLSLWPQRSTVGKKMLGDPLPPIMRVYEPLLTEWTTRRDPLGVQQAEADSELLSRTRAAWLRAFPISVVLLRAADVASRDDYVACLCVGGYMPIGVVDVAEAGLQTETYSSSSAWVAARCASCAPNHGIDLTADGLQTWGRKPAGDTLYAVQGCG